jgi:hypothetical protein
VYNLIIQVYISIVHLWGKMPPCYLYPIPFPLLLAPSRVGYRPNLALPRGIGEPIPKYPLIPTIPLYPLPIYTYPYIPIICHYIEYSIGNRVAT